MATFYSLDPDLAIFIGVLDNICRSKLIVYQIWNCYASNMWSEQFL